MATARAEQTPPTAEEMSRWQGDVEFWRTLDYWPANGQTVPKSPDGGLWHDCSWIERCARLIAELRRTREAEATP